MFMTDLSTISVLYGDVLGGAHHLWSLASGGGTDSRTGTEPSDQPPARVSSSGA